MSSGMCMIFEREECTSELPRSPVKSVPRAELIAEQIIRLVIKFVTINYYIKITEHTTT